MLKQKKKQKKQKKTKKKRKKTVHGPGPLPTRTNEAVEGWSAV